MIRAASVPTGVYRNAAHVSSGSRLPSYCCPQGQYFGFGGTSSAGQSAMPRASRAMYSSSSALSSRPSSVGMISRGSLPATYSRVTGSHYLDALPTRHFGSRLSRGYSSVASRPEIYEQAYGVSYLPSMGRDGCSSYTLAGATIDDSDDLVNTSYKRDNEVLRSVERQMANVYNAPPMVQQRSRVVRASSVPPQYSRTQPAQASRLRRTVGTRRPGGASVTVTARGSADNDVYYRVPQPAVIYKHETVNRGSDLLTMKPGDYQRVFNMQL